MGPFLDAIGRVSGPLTLIAFLAVVLLALFRRSVKDERGLEYVHQLFKEKLTRERFYQLATRIVTYAFLACVLIFVVGVGGFVAVKLWGGERRGGATQTLSHDNVYGDLIVTGSGDDIVASRGGQVAVGATTTQRERQQRLPNGQGELSMIIGGGPGEGNIILSGDGSERVLAANSGFRAEGKLRLSDTYRIDVLRDQSSTQGLRDLYGLRPIAKAESLDDADDWTTVIPRETTGVYAFTTPWLVGRIAPEDLTYSPLSAGAAVQEVHKRPSGVFAVVGFTSREAADALLALNKADQSVDIELSTLPNTKTRAVVSIPIARIEGVIHGGLSSFDVQHLRVW